MERSKIKYDQIAGNFFYLPCDITHYTVRKYFSVKDSIFPGFSSVTPLIGDPDESVLGDKGYYQDSYVQLFNGKDYKNITIINMKSLERLNWECIVKNCQIYKFGKYLRSYKKGDKFLLRLSENIIPQNGFTTEIIKLYKNEFLNDSFIEINISRSKELEYNQSKGGNFISSPNSTIFYIEGANLEFINELLKSKCPLVELKCGFKAHNNTFRHIDELMCFMPYGPGKYKVWFYDEFDKNCFDLLLGKDPNYINEKIQELNEERLQNLNIISKKLFRKPFNDCVDNFVFFKFYSFRPSIFNRTWYETERKCICLFPNGIIEPNLSKLKKEMTKVSSMINPKNYVNYDFIKVKSTNELHPEGTVHCLIKQRFVKPKHLHRLIELQCKPKEFPPRQEFHPPQKIYYPSKKFSSYFRSKYLKYKLKYLKLKKLLSEKENNIIL
jgi:hypothetical protein